MLAHCGALRERALRAAATAFGHRLMMDCIVPGGVAVDLSPQGEGHSMPSSLSVKATFPRLVNLYDNTASLQDRTVGTGRVSADIIRQYACGGYVGRASGRNFDARRDFAYAPYPHLTFKVPTLADGDVNARVWIRIHEVNESLSLIEQLLARLPNGAIRSEELGAHGGRGWR